MQEKAQQWEEVMELAEKYGFIRFAYAGMALLSIEEIENAKNNSRAKR